MAKKYVIFNAQNDWEIAKSKLAEIDITLTNNDGVFTIVFPDGLSTTFRTTYWNLGVADASTDLLIVSPSSNASSIYTKTSSTEGGVSFAYVFIAKTAEDTLWCNGGFAGVSTGTPLTELCNFSALDKNNSVHHNASLQNLDLVNFVGRPYVNGDYLYNKQVAVFKHCYVNYQRWFEFGTLIVDSNGNEYIADGWVLCRVNIDS